MHCMVRVKRRSVKQEDRYKLIQLPEKAIKFVYDFDYNVL